MPSGRYILCVCIQYHGEYTCTRVYAAYNGYAAYIRVCYVYNGYVYIALCVCIQYVYILFIIMYVSFVHHFLYSLCSDEVLCTVVTAQ